jgi:erythromycin esterase-like protein
MNSTTHEPLNLPSEELAILAELLESARAKLLIEIRHTDHRAFRDELRHRLTLVESLIERCGSTMSAGSVKTGPG